jgi:hypothetical protein
LVVRVGRGNFAAGDMKKQFLRFATKRQSRVLRF